MCVIRHSIVGSQYDASGLDLGVYPQRDAVRVAPRGELDLANVATLQAQLDELHAAGFAHVVLDLRELDFMDSTAVRLILREVRLARGAGRRFSLIKGSPPVQRVLEVSGVSAQLDFGERLGTPAVIEEAPSPAELDRRSSTIGFQRYIAQLRQQGRATRLTPGHRGRQHAR